MAGRSLRFTLSLVVGLGCAAASVSAQTSVAVDAGAVTIGDGEDAYAFLETGVRFSSLKPKRVSADVRLATAPQALASGVLVLATDIDAAYVAPLGEGVYLTPRIGASLILAAGGDDAAGLPGLNYGVGFVARLTEPLALRIDYTRFLYLLDPSAGASSFSIGIAWLH